MNRTTITIATIFGILAIGMVGALIAAWQEDNHRDMFTVSYWIGSLATVSHIFVAFGS